MAPLARGAEVAVKFGRVDFQSGTVPKAYRCGTCGAHGVKLWREYQTFLSQQTLECASCVGKSQKKDVSEMNAEGQVPWVVAPGFTPQWTTSIGWRVPAVPTAEGDTMWGFSSAPYDALMWWRRLPNGLPAKETP